MKSTPTIAPGPKDRSAEPALGGLTCAIDEQLVQSALRLCKALVGCEAEEARGLALVLGHTLPKGKAHPEVVLRLCKALVGCQAVEARGLPLVLRHARSKCKAVLRLRKALVGCQAVEARGLALVLRHTLSKCKAVSKVELRLRKALVGCEAVEACSLAAILRHALSRIVARPKLELPIWIALVGCEAVEARALALVLRHAIPKAVVQPKAAHRARVALVGCEAEEAHSLAPVLWHTQPLSVALSEFVLRIYIALVGCEAEEARCLALVLRHALPSKMAQSEVVLRTCITLVSCEAEAASSISPQHLARRGADQRQGFENDTMAVMAVAIVLSFGLLLAASFELPPGEPRHWSAADVTQWVGAIGWEEYRDAFAEAKVTGPKLLQLGKKQLDDDLQIAAPEHRAAILAEIAKLGKARKATAASRERAEAPPLAEELSAVRTHLAGGGAPGAPPVRTGPDKAVSRWTVSEVVQWLDEVGLPHAGTAARRFRVDGRRLEQFDSEEAVDAAVRGQIERGHRITLAQEVASLQVCEAGGL